MNGLIRADSREFVGPALQQSGLDADGGRRQLLDGKHHAVQGDVGQIAYQGREAVGRKAPHGGLGVGLALGAR